MTRNLYPGPNPDRAAAQRKREAAFARIGRVRGWTIVGAGALTAALAGVVSAVAPGRTLGAKTPVRYRAAVVQPSPAHTGPLKMPPLASPSQLGLQGPDGAPQAAPTQTQTSAPASQPQPAPAAPQPAPSSGGVVSGGS